MTPERRNRLLAAAAAKIRVAASRFLFRRPALQPLDLGNADRAVFEAPDEYAKIKIEAPGSPA
jgi:hypothetical protein